MPLRLENSDSETVSNETDPRDSLLSRLWPLPLSAMDGANARYNGNCVIFKPIVQQWGSRWDAAKDLCKFFWDFHGGE